MTVEPLLQIREFDAEDLDAVATIERHCFGHAWSPEQYQNGILEATACRGLVAVVDDHLVGFASITCLVGQAYIPTLGVLEPYRRMGIGRRLLDGLLRVARELRAREIVLEVRVSNDAAQRLYRERGFEVLGVRPNYYHDPPEDGLVMACVMEDLPGG